MGRCKNLGSLKSFLWYAHHLSVSCSFTSCVPSRLTICLLMLIYFWNHRQKHVSEFLGEVGVLESECQKRGFHSVPPFVCDKALPLPCCVSPGKTLTSLSQVLLGVQGGAKSREPSWIWMLWFQLEKKQRKKRWEQRKKQHGAGDDGGGWYPPSGRSRTRLISLEAEGLHLRDLENLELREGKWAV